MICNTTVSVLRGVTVTEDGDEVEESLTIARGMPMSIVERRQVVPSEAIQDVRTYRYATGRTIIPFDFKDRDRIRDERTGYVYLVDTVAKIPGLSHVPPTRLDLKFA